MVALCGSLLVALCGSLLAPGGLPAPAPACRMAVRLRGGQSDTPPDRPIVLRLRTDDGVKRLSMPSMSSTLGELRKALFAQHRMAARSIGTLSRRPDGEDPLDLDADADTPIGELGIKHGAFLYLSSGEKRAPAPKATEGGGSSRRRGRASTWQELDKERKEREVVMKAPPPPRCVFAALDKRAVRRFSDYLLRNEFAALRVARLYGTRAADGGVHVSVLYEPPQRADADGAAVDDDAKSVDEQRRADELADALGLRRVGVAYAQPLARVRAFGVDELALMCAEASAARELAGESAAKEGAKAKGGGYVALRFRAVWDDAEDAEIDGEVTAEAYEPTEQCESLVARGALVPCAKATGEASLDPDQDLELIVEGKAAPSVEASYFVSRVHDVGRPHTSRLRAAFPPSSRAGGVRTLHLKRFLEAQRKNGVAFADAVADFDLLLHVSSILDRADFDELLAVGVAPKLRGEARGSAERAKASRVIARCERLLCEHVGLAPPDDEPDEGATCFALLARWARAVLAMVTRRAPAAGS